MNGTLFTPHLRMEDWRRFAFALVVLAVAVLLLTMPDLAHAVGFDGKFGPDDSLVTNSDESAKGWWKFGATMALWVSIVWFIVSICFMGGKLWGIPPIIFLASLFGEKAVEAIKTMAGF